MRFANGAARAREHKDHVPVTACTGFSSWVAPADPVRRHNDNDGPDIRAVVAQTEKDVLAMSWRCPQAAGAVPRWSNRPGCQGVPSNGSRKRSTPIQPALRQARMRKIAKKARIGLVLTVPASR